MDNIIFKIGNNGFPLGDELSWFRNILVDLLNKKFNY